MAFNFLSGSSPYSAQNIQQQNQVLQQNPTLAAYQHAGLPIAQGQMGQPQQGFQVPMSQGAGGFDANAQAQQWLSNNLGSHPALNQGISNFISDPKYLQALQLLAQSRSF